MKVWESGFIDAGEFNCWFNCWWSNCWLDITIASDQYDGESVFYIVDFYLAVVSK